MIKKWAIRPPETVVRVTAGTKVLHVDAQHGEVCVWTDDTWCEMGSHELDYVFIPVTTGANSPPAHYVGSAMMTGDLGETLIWHIFMTVDQPETEADRVMLTRAMRHYADQALVSDYLRPH